MRFGMSGQRAVVTEATEGIGFAVVRALVDEGVHVIVGAQTSSAGLDELVATGFVDIAFVDLSSTDGPATLIERAEGRVDILINNLGLAAVCVDGTAEITGDLWWDSLGPNLIAATRATQAALPIMVAARRGAIVNVGYVNSALPNHLTANDRWTRVAVSDLAKSLPRVASSRGVRVNSVCTGVSRTSPWLTNHRAGVSLSRTKRVGFDTSTAVAASDFSPQEQTADLVVFLSSDQAINIAGANFVIARQSTPIIARSSTIEENQQ